MRSHAVDWASASSLEAMRLRRYARNDKIVSCSRYVRWPCVTRRLTCDRAVGQRIPSNQMCVWGNAMHTLRDITYRIARTIWQLPRHLLLGLLWLYRNAISPFTPPTCRFHPTCSSYAEQALREYGAVKGLILTIYRVSRCHPFGGSGYDPPRWFGEPPPPPLQDDQASGEADTAEQETCRHATRSNWE